jgi:hypothetical protein
MMNDTLPLTFGVELEFGIRHSHQPTLTELLFHGMRLTSESADTTVEAARMAITQLLCSAKVGLHAKLACDDYNRDDKDANDNPITAGAALPGSNGGDGGGGHGEYDFWQVADDLTIRFGPGIASVELRTPVFTAISTTNTSGSPPVADISPAASIDIRRALESICTRFSAYVNNTCGLHVHVGSITGGRRGFEPPTLSALATLLTCCERPLSMLHPTHRQTSRFAKPPSQVHYLQAFAPLDRLTALWRKRTIKGLRLRFNDDAGRFWAYNYWNLAAYPPFDDSNLPADDAASDSSAESDDSIYDVSFLKQTVEFRQFEGCLDADRVLAWVRVVCRLVEFAHSFRHRESPWDMLEQVLRFVPPTRPANAYDILQAIGLNDLMTLFPLHDATLPLGDDVVGHVMLASPSLRQNALAYAIAQGLNTPSIE